MNKIKRWLRFLTFCWRLSARYERVENMFATHRVTEIELATPNQNHAEYVRHRLALGVAEKIVGDSLAVMGRIHDPDTYAYIYTIHLAVLKPKKEDDEKIVS